MSVDVLPDSRPESEPQQSDSSQHWDRSSGGRWLRRSILLIGGLGVVAAIAVMLLSGGADEESTKLVHKVKRGNLIVSVTEQGTLESSSNTEIKCDVRGFSTVTFVIKGGSFVEPGDELVRLDTKAIEEQLSLAKTNTFSATATLERTKANVATAKISIDAYKKGRYRSQVKSLQRELAINTSNLNTARKMLRQSELLFRQGYVTDLEVAGNRFTVKQAELELNVSQTKLDVLEKYTRAMELETLTGNLTAANSKLKADEAGLKMEKSRRDRANSELAACVITAKRRGMVVYPSAAAWKRTPDIAEGAVVRKDQVLLLMPDLNKMQVKVGIHESIVERVTSGLSAKVTLPDRVLEAKVGRVAPVTRPAGWWTGNVVKYDTIIKLPSVRGLKPGMSAEVEVVLAEHNDVLLVPVAAVLETENGDFCWVKSGNDEKRRLLQLGDSNDVFVIVKSGLQEGDEVILNPAAVVAEAEAQEAANKKQKAEARAKKKPAAQSPKQPKPSK